MGRSKASCAGIWVSHWRLFLAGAVIALPVWSANVRAAESSAAALKQGESLLEDGEREKAIDAFSEAIRLDPKNARAYYWRASVYQRNGDAKGAEADLTRTAQIDPKGLRDYFNRGWAYGRSRQLVKAIANLTQLVNDYPTSAPSYRWARANCYEFQGEFDKAISGYGELLNSATKSATKKGFLFSNRGNAYLYKGHVDKAIQDQTEAMRLAPENATVSANRAWAYAEKGDFDRAVADANRALQLDANFAEAFAVGGYAYERNKLPEKARVDYATAARLEASNTHENEIRMLIWWAAGPEIGMTMNLPVYHSLEDAGFREYLGLTPQQEKKLGAVAARWMAEQRKRAEETAKLPQAEQEAKGREAIDWAVYQKTVAPLRKQVKEILTEQQLASLKKLLTAQFVCQRLILDSSPGAGGDRTEPLERLRKEFRSKIEAEAQDQSKELLVHLTASQRDRLHKECDRRLTNSGAAGFVGIVSASLVVSTGTLSVGSGTQLSGTNSVSGGTSSAGSAPNVSGGSVKVTNGTKLPEGFSKPLSLPAYYPLLDASVRNRLGMSAERQKQLMTIAQAYAAEMERPGGPGATPQEVNAFVLKRVNEVRGQIEGLLTPEQITALKECNFSDSVSQLVADPYIQDEIGLSNMQARAIEEARKAARQREFRFILETSEKVLAALTPEQRKARLAAFGDWAVDAGIAPFVQLLRFANPK